MTIQTPAPALDKYRQGDGFEDQDGKSYAADDVSGLLQAGILGFCECGRPEANLEYVLGALELIAEEGPDFHNDRAAFDAWHKDYEARCLAHHGSVQARYFFGYWADKEGFTDHGGSVNGAWLEDKGEELLALLREWKQMGEEE